MELGRLSVALVKKGLEGTMAVLWVANCPVTLQGVQWTFTSTADRIVLQFHGP